MAFDNLDIKIGGESDGAIATIQAVKTSLGGLERSANDAEDSVEEMGDSVSRSSASMGSLAATAGASALSLIGLSSASSGASGSMTALAASVTGTVVAIGALTALLAPLVVALGGLVVAGASVAGVFGLIAGATVATQFETIKEAAIDAKEGILGAVQSVGESFLPVLVDLIERLPYVADRIVRALGPLDPFVEAFEDLGNAILDALPGIVAFAADLTRDILPALREFGAVMADLIPRGVRGMVSAGRTLGRIILDLSVALRDLLRSRGTSDIFQAIDESIRPLIPQIRQLLAEFRPLLSTLAAELPSIIRGVGAFIDTLLDIAAVVAPIVVPALQLLVKIIGTVAGAFAAWVNDSEQKEGQILGVINSVVGGFKAAAQAITDAWAYLTGRGENSLLGDVSQQVRGVLDLLQAVPGIDADIGSTGDSGGGSRSRSQSRGSRSRVPSLDSGGRIVEGGLARVHRGEEVVPAAQVDRGGGGGISPAALQQALAGMELSLSGGLNVADGVATVSDVRGELRRAGREADNRGIN